MAKIYEFPSGTVLDRNSSPESQYNKKYKGVNENNAIAFISKQRFNQMVSLREKLSVKNSDTYKRAYAELKKCSKFWILEMLENASELDIKNKPKYHIAAFNILME